MQANNIGVQTTTILEDLALVVIWPAFASLQGVPGIGEAWKKQEVPYRSKTVNRCPHV